MIVVWLGLFLWQAGAPEWPGFRGGAQSGVSANTGLPVRFDQQTNLAWRVPVPPGRSSPIVAGSRVVVTAVEGERLFVSAFDAATGKPLWRHTQPRAARSELDDKRNDGAAPTPATDGEAVYAFFQDFGLIALRLDGTVLWRLPLGPFANNYGMGASPIVQGETVFLQCDQTRGSFLLAVHRRTGKVRWRLERESAIEGWVTPLVLAERGLLIVMGSHAVEARETETGRLRWSVPVPNSILISSPSTDGEHVFAVVRGSEQPTVPDWAATLADLDANQDGKLVADEIAKRYNRGSFGIADPNRDGFITESEWEMFRRRGVGEYGISAIRIQDGTVMWRYKRGLPYVPSPVLYRGVLYSVRDGGIITALNAGDGTLHREGRAPEAPGLYQASPVAADGKVYFAGLEGKVTAVQAGADWKVLAVNDLGEGMMATPAIAHGSLFVRTEKALYCFRQK